MPTYKVRLFEVPPSDGVTLSKPEEVPGFAVDGDNVDRAKERVAEQLRAHGYPTHRSINLCTSESGDLPSFVAYVPRKE